MRQKNGLKRLYALGRMKPGHMNKTEAAYAEHLKLMQAAGEILWWRFEGLKFKLADNTFYTPDFTVLCADGTLEAVKPCKCGSAVVYTKAGRAVVLARAEKRNSRKK